MTDVIESRVALRGAETDIEPVRTELERCAECWGIPQDCVFKVQIALDEIVSNAIRHRGDGAEPAIEVFYRWSGDALEVEVMDDGPAFNPLEAPTPEFQDALETVTIGGLGIYMVRELMDSVTYRRQDGRNCLKMRKQTQQ